MFEHIWKKEYADNKYLIDFLQNEKIKNRVSANLFWYIKKATESKYGYYTLTIITIVAPVVSAIILNGPFEGGITKLVAGIILGFSTIAASLIPLFNYHKKWIIYRNQAEDIKRILAEAYIDDNLDENVILEKIEKSIAKTDEKWTNEHKKEN